MASIEEIKSAIETLSPLEFVRLRNWLLEKDWHDWDRQIEADSNAGKLDFLIDEAAEEKAKGTLKDL
jgi:endo-1,4-beta-mannosidase